MQTKYEIEWYKARTERDFREATAEEERRRTEIEMAQLYDGNPFNDKLKNIR
jgi:hypothetical protein